MVQIRNTSLIMKFNISNVINALPITIITWLFILVLPVSLSAQSKLLQNADELFNSFNYQQALAKYLQVEKRGESVYYCTKRIADCYRLTGDFQQAEKWYTKAISFPDKESMLYFYLGQSLNAQKKYNEALPHMETYFVKTGYPFLHFTKNYESAIRFIKNDSSRFELLSLPINSEFSEFGPVVLGSKLYFASNRPNSGMIKRRDARNNLPFYDLYTSDMINSTTLENTKLADAVFNSVYNDGPICFSKEGDMAFITRNTHQLNVKGKNRLSIMVSVLKKDKWSKELDVLPLRNQNYSVSHPFISPDGKRIYFSSDMPGGYGGQDLYYSDFKGNFIGAAVNLGPLINTPGNELFPFITTDGSLYFTSDGHPGLGGLDILFCMPQRDGNFTPPFNPGYPINSSDDDFSIYFHSNSQSGYLASNRKGGYGNDDIYAFNALNALRLCEITGTIINAEYEQPLSGVLITIVDADGNVFNEFESAANGNFKFYLPANMIFNVLIRKKLFENQDIVIAPSDMQNHKSIDLQIKLNRK